MGDLKAFPITMHDNELVTIDPLPRRRVDRSAPDDVLYSTSYLGIEHHLNKPIDFLQSRIAPTARPNLDLPITF